MKESRYEEIYEKLEQDFLRDSASLLSEDAISQTLVAERKRFEQAKQFGTPCSFWIGSSLARYCKDLIRQNQPGYFLYYLIGLLTEYSCIMMLWIAFRQTFFFFAGSHSGTFIQTANLGYSLFISAGYLLFKHLSLYLYRKKLLTGRIPSRIPALMAGLALALAGIVPLWMSPIHSVFTFRLDYSFFFYAGMIALSGICNVIYQSHWIDFFQIGLLRITKHSSQQLHNRTDMYLAKSRQQYEASGKSAGFYASLRQRLISNRAYCVLGGFLSFILIIVCMFQLIQNISSTLYLIVFTLLATLLFLLLSCSVLSYHLILQTLEEQKTTF